MASNWNYIDTGYDTNCVSCNIGSVNDYEAYKIFSDGLKACSINYACARALTCANVKKLIDKLNPIDLIHARTHARDMSLAYAHALDQALNLTQAMVYAQDHELFIANAYTKALNDAQNFECTPTCANKKCFYGNNCLGLKFGCCEFTHTTQELETAYVNSQNIFHHNRLIAYDNGMDLPFDECIPYTSNNTYHTNSVNCIDSIYDTNCEDFADGIYDNTFDGDDFIKSILKQVFGNE